MESEKITPDRKMKNLLSSYISKTLDEQGRKRKRSLTEIQSENTVQVPSDRERKKNVDSQDEDAFFERVETYDMMSWFAKPMELSPLVCSRFGWKNTESDMLQCVGCKVVLCGQLPKRADSLIYNESCKKLKDNLRMAHMKSCFWPAYPSPEYFSSIPIRDKRKVISRIIAYIESLQKLQENLPHISFKTFDDKGMSANYLEEIKCTVEKQFEQNHLDNVEVGTFCLAVTGWKGINSKEALLSCHYCRRKVGLWNYKNNHNKDDASEDSSADSDTDVKYSDSKSAIPVIESQTCTENANNHQETNQENSSHSSVQSDACVEKCFNFSQPNVIDSQKINETDTSLSVQSNIYSGNIYSFSQPNILECSSEIVDGGMTNECNKMSENDKSETTNDTIINEQNKLLSNGKHDLKSLESSSSENNTNVKEIDSLSEKIELKQDQVKESQVSSNSSLEEGNTNDKSVEESHMSSDISVGEGNTNDKSVEESHMSSDISVEEGNTNDKSVEESHMSSDISVEEGNTNDKSVEESHMSSDISVGEGNTNDKSVEESHMSSDISVGEGNTNDKSVEESHMSSDISVGEGNTNDKSVEESHMSSDISVEEGNTNDKSVEESHMSSDISVGEGNTNDKSVEESHMSSDISVEEGNTNDKSVEESHRSSDISVEEGNTNDKSVEESHMSSDISVEEGNTNDKSVEESHMSSDISVEEGNTNDKSVEESHMSSDISVEEGNTNDKSIEESHMSSDISIDVSSQKNSTGDLQNNDTNVAEVAEPPKRKKIKVVKKDTFDPLEEHRYWCPWIIELPEGITCSPKKISEMTEGGEKKASYPWEHVLQIICPSFFDVSHEDSVSKHFKQHSPVAGLRQLRNLMRDWSN